MGRGGYQGGRNVLQGGGTGGSNIWLRELGTFGGNVEKCRGHTQGFSEENHGEASVAENIRDMVDTQGGISAGRGGNSVGDELYRKMTGNCGTVGGTEANC